ncbi:uncharacterized protein [Montipora capricornis]|uniref:uncharacterized protein n=1 Tax=Montipora capricornis TaxID=246305 RepID=UPI0035F20BEA
MGSAESELNKLTLNLKKVQEKFLQWTGDSLKKSLLEGKQNHEKNLLDRKERIQELEQSISRKQIQSEQNLEALRQRAEEVANLEKELRELQITGQCLAERRNETQKQLEETHCCVQKQQKEILAKEQSTSNKMQQFNKGTEHFKERLGLAFKKVDDENLQFVFKYIDPEDEEKPFVFTVAITAQNKYSVTKCIPEVEGMEDMIHQLNATNNFSKFVRSMRKGFKETTKAPTKSKAF